MYCTLCGNKEVHKTNGICPACRAIVKGPLKKAYALYQELQKDHRQCCGGLSHSGDYLYFHGKGWDNTYPRRKLKIEDDATWVEMGVSLYEDHARTYYIFDSGSLTLNEDYGEEISYKDPNFWNKVFKQLDRASEFAWGKDVLTCLCGHNYMVLDPCDCIKERDENIMVKKAKKSELIILMGDLEYDSSRELLSKRLGG
ncbi:MAG: hypothetical protein LUQ37_08670 [Methanoregulaceae archaeon]|jgi:hypothetical protein|nr:hypothetical protein [Methanoregulaceae archaeon]